MEPSAPPPAYAPGSGNDSQIRLINDVQGIDIRELGVGRNRGNAGAIDWPQICVVGGQSAGKSTLLSAVVSANLYAPLKFLPEGTDMVTRCPICVQMQCPSGQHHHTAKVFTDERLHGVEEGEAGGGSGTSDIPCDGGQDPSAEQLAAWGKLIQTKISSVQDIIEPSGRNVTGTKIIVRLTGPRMINLSLVDLPGLTQADPRDRPGLKDKIKELVRQTILSPNSVILAVGEAGVDPATWVGTGLANEVDPHNARTIGVVTKTDLMFLVGNETSLANRQQIQRVIKDNEGDIEWFAAYNPSPGDDQFLPDDLQEQIAADFGADKAGNVQIAHSLSDKLMVHLADQLPRLHRQFHERAGELRKELKMSFKPSWTMVEQLVLTYGRFVQDYSQGVLPADATGRPFTEIWGEDRELFPHELMRVMKEYQEKNTAIRIYQAKGAGGAGGGKSILHNSTKLVLQEADGYRISLSQVHEDGEAQAKTDREVALPLARGLSGKLKDLTQEVDACMESQVKPLVQQFYDAVSKVTFRYKSDEGEVWTGSVSQYGNLWREIQTGTERILEENTEHVKDQIKVNTPKTTTSEVNNQFMPYDEVVAALTRLCQFHMGGAAEPAPAPAPEQLTRQSSGLTRQQSASVVAQVVAPQVACYKQKPTLKTWPARYIRMCYGERLRGINVYDDEHTMAPRRTSIDDLTGCDINDRLMEPFTFSRDLYKLVIYKRGMQPEEQVNLAFEEQADRDRVAAACRNLAAGREWNESEEDRRRKDEEAERAAAAERKRAEQAAVAAALAAQEAAMPVPEPEPEPSGGPQVVVPDRAEATEGEYKALRGEAHNEAEFNRRGELLDICSPVFYEFYQRLKKNPTSSRVLESMDDEIRAEAFRLWSLKYVLTNLAQMVATTERELRDRFLDTKGRSAPFSAVSIFSSVGLSKMIEKSCEVEYAKKSGTQRLGRENKTADFLLSIHDGVPNRRKKEGYLATLEDIIQRFSDHGYVM